MAKSKYKKVNYIKKYGPIMHFNQNKDAFIHGWYPFVEGYSKDFIVSIINELKQSGMTIAECLDPFAGSGTTPLELQKLGISCYSFEVSPFMHTLATTKMNTSYTADSFKLYLDQINHSLSNCINNIQEVLPPPLFRTIVETPELTKWNFNKEVMDGILDIKYAINNIANSDYQNLFKIALASILLNVSNLYRNGKCLSYKKKWKESTLSRTEVHNIYTDRLQNTFLPDIVRLEEYSKNKKLISNRGKCILGDSRIKLAELKDDSIDLVITSPPYLNSRDYTDTYMVELRMLDFINNHNDLQNHRKSTFRSHVQILWDEVQPLDIPLLETAVKKISKHKEQFWNKSLLNMINGYFEDMDILFSCLKDKMKANGKIYFNVANSAYFGVEIKTNEIICEIAERNGFSIDEIRKARKVYPSSQQKEKIEYLLESVIVMTRI